MILALVGNQNCGKTTLFNQLTGSNRHVGNFPGVTVDSKMGTVRGTKDCRVVDLPGIYSLRPYTGEEVITRDFLLREHPDGIINIVDATNIERNLYLTLQLLEMNLPTVLALNMMDEVRGNGGAIDVPGMSGFLGIPVIPVSAAKNEGVDDVIAAAMRVARGHIRPRRMDFCKSGAVHRCIRAVSHLIEDRAARAGISPRFAATKVIEGDGDIIGRLGIDRDAMETAEHAVTEMEREEHLDRHEALAAMRYGFIEEVARATVVRCRESREHARSVRIDRVLTHKYLAIPIFLVIMLSVFALTFAVLGEFLNNLLEWGIASLGEMTARGLDSLRVHPVIRSLIVEGVFGGVGAVISFLPYIVVLFFFLSVLEDTGYMARVAFVMDKPLRKIGLSGRSFVPMLIGFGCTVPAVMSTRTLSSGRDRKMTVLLTPFMSCSAKMTVYLFFADLLFENPWARFALMAGLYSGGVAVGILAAWVMSRTLFCGNPPPFMMELPNYRFPSGKSVLLLLREKARDFLQKAFSVILVASVMIWLLNHFDPGLSVTDDPSASMLGRAGSLFAVIFRPLGFGSAEAVAALISGFSAKEAVVSTLQQLAPAGDVGALFPTVASALSFLTFTLFYTPCIAAVAAIRSEMKSRRATLGVVLSQCAVAWVISFLVYRVALVLPHLRPADCLITAAVLFWIVAALVLLRRRRAAGRSLCGGNCGGCPGCASNQKTPGKPREEKIRSRR